MVRNEVNTNSKYENIAWAKKMGHRHYSPFQAGFGYILSKKSVEIIYNALSKTKNEIAFNKLEDTYLGHFLSSFDIKYVDITPVITARTEPNRNSLEKRIVDHWYVGEKKKWMLFKYNLHKSLIQKDNEAK